MRTAGKIAVGLATLLACATASADGSGLSTDSDRVPWARFQGRIAYAANAPALRTSSTATDASGLKVAGVSLMGDVYFGASPTGAYAQGGGFRATSGVIVGARGALWGTPAGATATGLLSVDRRLFGPSGALPGVAADASADSATLPYIGIGYSSLAGRSGWSFSADLGLVSLSPGNAVRLGRVFGGGQNLDDVVRDMRLAPVLQLGASYAF